MEFPYIQIKSSLWPLLPIVLRNGDYFVGLEALLDSGSSINLIDEEYAAIIGIDDIEENGIEVPIEGVGGAIKKGYRHDVVIEFFGGSIMTSVVFLPNMSDQFKAILGQEGFFGVGEIQFRYAKRKFTVNVKDV